MQFLECQPASCAHVLSSSLTAPPPSSLFLCSLSILHTSVRGCLHKKILCLSCCISLVNLHPCTYVHTHRWIYKQRTYTYSLWPTLHLAVLRSQWAALLEGISLWPSPPHRVLFSHSCACAQSQHPHFPLAPTFTHSLACTVLFCAY